MKQHAPIINQLVEKGFDRAIVIKVLSEEKKHSDFSASGSERWLNCAASVRLSRLAPKSPNNFWSVEGTLGHYYLEKWVNRYKETGNYNLVPKSLLAVKEMYDALKKAMKAIRENWDRDTEILETEQRVSLEYIEKGMFGTGDLKIYDPVFRKLKVYDYKHGKSPVETEERSKLGIRSLNTQLMFYALGLAKEIGFKNLDEIEIGIIQPRVQHVNGYFRTSVFGVKTLRDYETFFKKGVERAHNPNARVHAGPWCHWCPAKDFNCPAHEQMAVEKAASYF